MNILMMSNTFTPIVGGLEKSIQMFTAQFRKLGHKVMVVAPEFKNRPKKEYHVLRLPSIQQFNGTDFSVNLPIPGLLSQLMDSFKPDLVHAHHPFLVGDLALRLCGQYKIPLVYTYHTMFDLYTYYRFSVVDEIMKRFLMELSLSYASLADHVIAPSESVRDFLRVHEVETPIDVVPAGVDIKYFAKGNAQSLRERLRIPRNAYVVGHLGRLSPEKNLEFLARSVALFLKKQQRAHFIMIGKGPSSKTLKKMFKEAHVEERVHWAGVLHGKKLVDGYHAMDVFVFASQSETQGMVLIESMACGVPVVALDASGVREVVVNGKNGRLVASENEKKFSQALSWCFDRSSSRSQKLKEEALKTAERFSIEKCAERALQVYQLIQVRKYMLRRIQKSQWRVVMRRLKTEWDLLMKVTKATGAALAITGHRTPSLFRIVNAAFFIISFFNLPLAYPESVHESHKMHDAMHHEMPTDGQHEMKHAMNGMFGPYPMIRETTGTSWQPESSPHEGIPIMKEDRMFMIHGFANVVYDDPRGKRGRRDVYSTNMLMGMAQHPFALGTWGLRGMFSLEPLTVGKRGYPILLQTGETANGVDPLIDRQHPHDLFMELASTYSVPITHDSSTFIYFGLPGEPALGPPAFMHRFSGMEIPEAPLTHHWLDSTHIVYGVVTLGAIWKQVKLDGSIFRGREPDEGRWDIETPGFDSYSGRITFNPTKDLSLQTSYGRLDSPEQLEPEVDTHRWTTSITYNKPWHTNNWQTTFAWGKNFNVPGHNSDGFLLESAFHVKHAHTLLFRFEEVEKDELFHENDPEHGRPFWVTKFSLGYIFDFPVWNHLQWGIGTLGNIHFLPGAVDEAYGNTPLSYLIFTRVKIVK